MAEGWISSAGKGTGARFINGASTADKILLATASVSNANTSYTFTDLDGDTDVEYFISIKVRGVVTPGAGTDLLIKCLPNGDSTSTAKNVIHAASVLEHTTYVNATSYNSFILARGGTTVLNSSVRLVSESNLRVKSGNYKSCVSYNYYETDSTTDRYIGMDDIITQFQNTDKLTSLTISITGGTFTSGFISLYRVKQ
jgi:hypothetical protein